MRLVENQNHLTLLGQRNAPNRREVLIALFSTIENRAIYGKCVMNGHTLSIYKHIKTPPSDYSKVKRKIE